MVVVPDFVVIPIFSLVPVLVVVNRLRRAKVECVPVQLVLVEERVDYSYNSQEKILLVPDSEAPLGEDFSLVEPPRETVQASELRAVPDMKEATEGVEDVAAAIDKGRVRTNVPATKSTDSCISPNETRVGYFWKVVPAQDRQRGDLEGVVLFCG